MAEPAEKTDDARLVMTLTRDQLHAVIEEATKEAIHKRSGLGRASRWITVGGAAKRCGVVPQTVRNWIRDAGLPAFQPGSSQRARFRISVDELEEWAAGYGLTPIDAGSTGAKGRKRLPPKPHGHPLSPRLRFHILSRDGFRCRYCGRKAPDVTLHVDHVQPRSRGGSDDDRNLVTSCVDCNSGKSDKVLE